MPATTQRSMPGLLLGAIISAQHGKDQTDAVRAPQDLADVDVAIVRAAFGIAQTGSILLSDSELRVNAIAYLAQHLIALLDPADVLINLHLIHGAQGVRSFAVLHLARTRAQFVN